MDDLEEKESDDILENVTNCEAGHEDLENVIGFDVGGIPEELELISQTS